MATLYRNSDIRIYGLTSSHSTPCEVMLNNEQLRLTFKSAGYNYVLTGHENGPGHFELYSVDGTARGTLHRFKDGLILEGALLHRPGLEPIMIRVRLNPKDVETLSPPKPSKHRARHDVFRSR